MATLAKSSVTRPSCPEPPAALMVTPRAGPRQLGSSSLRAVEAAGPLDQILAEAWLFHLLGRTWEGDPFALGEHDGLEVVGDALAHHGAVAIALDVLGEPLPSAPSGVAPRLLTLQPWGPGNVEQFPEPRCVLGIAKVNEGVTEALLGREIHRQVDEIVAGPEALRVQQAQQHRPRERRRHVAQLHGRPRLVRVARHGAAGTLAGGRTLGVDGILPRGEPRLQSEVRADR
mmetsp:Transcript_5194/g.14570  ORF Transcript_5194/g.14570 Transcript_5194/m.14570 type:complete len:230 (-) Transcript_5194:186-875(-)